jgi:flagellar motor switch protein FliN/FliY
VVELLDLRVTLVAVLAEKVMTLGQVLALTPGTVVEFDQSHTAPLQLRIDDRAVAAGKAVRVGESFGLQITEAAPAKELLGGM